MENNKYVRPYLAINESAREIRYLGYKLALSAGEYEVIKAVMLSHNGITKMEIAESVRQGVKLSPSSVGVHVCSINKKARKLGGRNLIFCNKDKRYEICPSV